jgi:hypothetical protein
MLSRVRQKDLTKEAKDRGYTGQITRRGVWLATNPNGKDWLWERFVSDKKHEGTEYFKSTSLDNPHLPPEYVQALLSYPEPWVRRYVLCSFEDFGGSIYPDFQWDTHVIPPLKEMPRDVDPLDGLRPGHTQPDGRPVGLGRSGEPPPRRHRRVPAGRRRRDGPRAGVAPDRGQAQDERALARRRPVDRHARPRHEHGALGHLPAPRLHFQHGPKQHKDRIPALGQLIHTKRFVLTTECPMTYEAIKGYRWEDITPAQRSKGVDPREAPLKKDDHLVD